VQHPVEPSDVDLSVTFTRNPALGLDLIYRHYGRLVYQTAYRLLNNVQEADDLTQEIFMQLWRRWTYNPLRGSLASYLRILTYSRGIDRLRSRNCNRRCLERYSQQLEETQPSKEPLELAVRREQAGSVVTALEHLPEYQRQVLTLAYYGGLSQTQIAERLKTPLGTIKGWTRQGQQNLRRRLEKVV